MPSEFTIDTPLQAFYIQDMLRNAEAVQRCNTRLKSLFEPIGNICSPESYSKTQRREILDEIQSLVTFAGGLARYFWPARKAHEARGAYLRTTLGLDDSSPLANKDLRNAMEHFDERLDKYLRVGMWGYVVTDYVGSSHSEIDKPTHVLRAFYVDAQTFVLLNEEFELAGLVREVMRLCAQLRRFDRCGGAFDS